jgi:dual specificity MAP kinase phosphatase
MSQPIAEYSKISEHIYLGTNACCLVKFKEELLSLGIRADISLEKERIDAPHGVDFFTWVPVDDHTAPTQDQIKFLAATIDHFVKNNIKMYVHCMNGHGRGPTAVAAYLVYSGLTTDDAFAVIKKSRPEIHPNQEQIEAIRNFEVYLSQ